MFSRTILEQSTLQKFIAVSLVITMFTSIFTSPAQAQSLAKNHTLSEPYKDLYVIYSHPGHELVGVELRNQRQLPNGDVEASISIRGDSLIAYELIFEVNCSPQSTGEGQCPSNNTQTWTNVEFLPLYPGRVYDLGNIRIPRGSSFVVKAAKFGLEEDSLGKMTMIQLSLLAVHLVGVTPPIGYHEFPQATIDSFKIVIGPIGAVASTLSAIYKLIFERDDPIGALGDIKDAVLELDSIQELIADVINLIVVNGPKITGGMVGKAFDALNLLKVVGYAERTVEAFNQLRNHPELVTATITLAPEVIEWPDRYRVFEIGEFFETEMTLRNAGGELWGPDQDYALLVMLEKIPIQIVPLDTYVRTGEDALWNIPQRAPPVPGVFRLRYQMTQQGYLIGRIIPAEIVVVPENSSNLRTLIKAMIADAKAETGDRFDELISALERHITEALLAEIERRLLEICGGTGSIPLILIGFYGWSSWRRKRKHDR